MDAVSHHSPFDLAASNADHRFRQACGFFAYIMGEKKSPATSLLSCHVRSKKKEEKQNPDLQAITALRL